MSLSLVDDDNESLHLEALQDANRDLKLQILDQTKIIEALRRSIIEKDEKICHLESLLLSSVPAIKSNGKGLMLDITSEEEICELQVARLKTFAQERDLTLDETRKLDLLVKTKKHFESERQKNKNTIDITDQVRALTIEQLNKIAGPPLQVLQIPAQDKEEDDE